MTRILMRIVVAGAALLALGCSRGAVSSGPQRVEVSVTDRGFEPREIPARFGVPVTLVVTRKTDATCAKELVIADENIRRELPLNQAVEVAFTPEKSGEIPFVCGMGMVSGKIVVR